MRTRTAAVTVTVAALTAGLTAVAALRRRAGHGPSASTPAPVALPEGAGSSAASREVPAPVVASPAAVHEGVILPFVRPLTAPSALTPSAPPASPTRCGDTGGRTKAGAPCAARASADGRCRHHQLAA